MKIVEKVRKKWPVLSEIEEVKLEKLSEPDDSKYLNFYVPLQEFNEFTMQKDYTDSIKSKF